MTRRPRIRPIEILLAEDNEADARLTGEVLMEAKICNNVSWVRDGVDTLRFLRRMDEHASAPKPDLLLLNLDLPEMDGREVLAEGKNDSALCHISVAIMRSPRKTSPEAAACKPAAASPNRSISISS